MSTFFCCYFSLLSVSYHPSLGVILIVCQKCVFTHPYQASFKLPSTENVKRRHSHCSSYNNSSWNSNTEKERESAMNLECEWRHTQGREAEEQENLENVNQAFQREKKNQRIKYGKMLRKSMKNGKWGEEKSISTQVKVVALSSSFLFVDPSFSASFGLIFSFRVSSCALCFAFLLLLSIEHFVVKKLWVKFHRRKLSFLPSAPPLRRYDSIQTNNDDSVNFSISLFALALLLSLAISPSSSLPTLFSEG